MLSAMLSDKLPILWHLEISHYNEKARWALDLKGVPHVRRPVTPGLQELRARRLRAGRTVPILELGGRAIGDSTAIIEEVERRWPEPPLYPSDPGERRRALDLEEYFDEAVGPSARRVLFADCLTEPDKFTEMFSGRGSRGLGVFKTVSPALVPLVRRRFEIEPTRVAESREVVRGALDLVEAEAGPEGYLVGDEFTVADLTAASILGLLVVPPRLPYVHLSPEERPAAFREFRASLADRPGFLWVGEMYERHRGVSAAVAG